MENMNPREKAKEITGEFHKMDFRLHLPENYRFAKGCALICVNEIMKDEVYSDSQYWNEVKNEIENL